jgi:YD repeat-containing protein
LVSYTYDTLNRLATASSNAGWADSYTYDEFGNLTDKTPTAGSPPALHVTVNAATARDLPAACHRFSAVSRCDTMTMNHPRGRFTSHRQTC